MSKVLEQSLQAYERAGIWLQGQSRLFVVKLCLVLAFSHRQYAAIGRLYWGL
jgi:hypothetical protein